MITEELERVSQRLDEALEELHAHPDPRIRAAVAEVSEGLQRIHAEGLRRMAGLLAEDRERFRRALDDPVISNLFLLYDLVLVDEDERIRRAVEAMDSFLAPRGWSLQFLGTEEGVVRLRVSGGDVRLSADVDELRRRLHTRLRSTVPGYRKLELEGAGEPPTRQNPAQSGDPGWEERFRQGETVTVVPEATLQKLDQKLGRPDRAGESAGSEGADARAVVAARATDVGGRALFGKLVDGYPVLLVRVAGGDTLRAYRNACPGSILPLHLGSREGDRVRCPWHGCGFDLATGERLEGEQGPGLEPLETWTDEGEIWVKLG